MPYAPETLVLTSIVASLWWSFFGSSISTEWNTPQANDSAEHEIPPSYRSQDASLLQAISVEPVVYEQTLNPLEASTTATTACIETDPITEMETVIETITVIGTDTDSQTKDAPTMPSAVTNESFPFDMSAAPPAISFDAFANVPAGLPTSPIKRTSFPDAGTTIFATLLLFIILYLCSILALLQKSIDQSANADSEIGSGADDKEDSNDQTVAKSQELLESLKDMQEQTLKLLQEKVAPPALTATDLEPLLQRINGFETQQKAKDDKIAALELENRAKDRKLEEQMRQLARQVEKSASAMSERTAFDPTSLEDQLTGLERQQTRHRDTIEDLREEFSRATHSNREHIADLEFDLEDQKNLIKQLEKENDDMVKQLKKENHDKAMKWAALEQRSEASIQKQLRPLRTKVEDLSRHVATEGRKVLDISRDNRQAYHIHMRALNQKSTAMSEDFTAKSARFDVMEVNMANIERLIYSLRAAYVHGQTQHPAPPNPYNTSNAANYDDGSATEPGTPTEPATGYGEGEYPEEYFTGPSAGRYQRTHQADNNGPDQPDLDELANEFLNDLSSEMNEGASPLVTELPDYEDEPEEEAPQSLQVWPGPSAQQEPEEHQEQQMEVPWSSSEPQQNAPEFNMSGGEFAFERVKQAQAPATPAPRRRARRTRPARTTFTSVNSSARTYEAMDVDANAPQPSTEAQWSPFPQPAENPTPARTFPSTNSARTFEEAMDVDADAPQPSTEMQWSPADNREEDATPPQTFTSTNSVPTIEVMDVDEAPQPPTQTQWSPFGQREETPAKKEESPTEAGTSTQTPLGFGSGSGPATQERFNFSPTPNTFSTPASNSFNFSAPKPPVFSAQPTPSANADETHAAKPTPPTFNFSAPTSNPFSFSTPATNPSRFATPAANPPRFSAPAPPVFSAQPTPSANADEFLAAGLAEPQQFATPQKPASSEQSAQSSRTGGPAVPAFNFGSTTTTFGSNSPAPQTQAPQPQPVTQEPQAPQPYTLPPTPPRAPDTPPWPTDERGYPLEDLVDFGDIYDD